VLRISIISLLLYHLGMKASNVSVMRSNMKPELICATSEVQVAHIAHVGIVEVQQFVTEQCLVTSQLYLAHLCIT